MKQTLAFVFLVFLTVNTNLFSMEKEQNLVKQDPQVRLSKMDWVKITAASLGCALLSWAALQTYPLYNIVKAANGESFKPGVINIPAALSTAPFFVIHKFLISHDWHYKYETLFGLSGATSSLLAGCLGLYVYKKLAKLRFNKTSVKK